MATGKVKMFNGDKGFGFITPESPKEIPGLQTGKDVFVHVSGLLEGVVLREGQKVEFDVQQGKKGPEARNVRPEGQIVPTPVILEIRQIVSGDKGPVIVRRTNERVCLPGSGLRDLAVGTPIAITGWEHKEKVTIATGFPLTNRMVVRSKAVLGYGDMGLILQAGMAFEVSMPVISEFVESTTEVDRMWWSGGERGGDILTYYLIKKGGEEQIRRRFTWAAFLKMLIDGFGLYDIVKGAPQSPDDRLATEWKFQDSAFEAAFRPHDDRQPIAGNMVGMDEAMAELIRRHLAPIVIFQRRVARGEITGEATVQAGSFWTVWEQHREAFCSQFGPNVKPEKVLAYLLQTESVFPEPNDGLTGDLAATAREWSRTREATKVLQASNAARKPYPTLFPEDLTESDLAQAYVSLGREPRLEDIVDFDLIEANYPSAVEVPSVGQRVAKYRASNGKVYGAIQLTACEIMQATADPTIPGAIVWGYTCEIEFSSVPEPLQKMQGWTRKALLRKAFLLEKPNLPPANHTWWTNSECALLPVWPEAQIVAHVDHVGDVEVFPYIFRATATGIMVSGWAQSEGEIRFARQSFAQAIGVWEARRGETVPLCKGCGKPLWSMEVPGSYQGQSRTILVCEGGCKSPEYPYILKTGSSKCLYTGNSHSGEGSSFDLDSLGVHTGPRHGTGQRPATMGELDSIEIVLGQLDQLEQCRESVAAARGVLSKLIESLCTGETAVLGSAKYSTIRDLISQVPDFIAVLPILSWDGIEICDPTSAVAHLMDDKPFDIPNQYGMSPRPRAQLTDGQRVDHLGEFLADTLATYRQKTAESTAQYLAKWEGNSQWEAIKRSMESPPKHRDEDWY